MFTQGEAQSLLSLPFNKTKIICCAYMGITCNLVTIKMSCVYNMLALNVQNRKEDVS